MKFVLPILAVLTLSACTSEPTVDPVPVDPNAPVVEDPTNRPCGGTNPSEFGTDNCKEP